ncbi:cysteine hydrolase family protein [Allofustis seminis]|uniref:cysteine hydrolase family protein n=1 Tax=Allofustis seminis TaxID=166939 RepID=UPI00036A15CD|nr:isochorismatase family cysteine hydrolase [Allofustis seminis]
MPRNAFLIIDMQRDFLDEDSPLVVKAGLEALPHIERALEATRKSNVPVFHVFRLYRGNGSDVEVTRYEGWKSNGGSLVPGTEGAEIPASIAPIDGEYLIVKQRWSAFFMTELDLVLRRLGVRQVILTGVQTPNCIRGTAWDANSLDYEVICLTDGTNAANAEVHEQNLRDMKNIGVKLMTTDEYVENLEKDPEGPEANLQAEVRKEILASDVIPEPSKIY